MVVNQQTKKETDEMEQEKYKPVIIGRNDGCLICDDLGYICDDCLFDYFDEEQDDDQ